jgi:hypothetical protein
MTKTLDDFRAKHDPSYVLQTPQTILRRDLAPAARRFIITAAQNGTPVHEDFFACLLTAAKTLKAELLVVPLRYKNPTSTFAGSLQNAEWWAPATVPYLWNQRHTLNKNLVLLADIKTQPTAVDPLAGMDGISGDFSGILAHTKLRLRSVPTPHGKMAKILTTTGACTVENYSDTRAGKVGEFHHSLSAVLVELDGPVFHIRQLHYSAKNRRILDLDNMFIANGYGTAPRALAVVKGDTHVDFCDPSVDVATHGPEGLVETVNPEYIIEHDLLDGYSCNPHHKGLVFNAVAKRLAGRDSIKDEVQRAIDYVAARRRKGSTTVIVGSNHNDFLGRAITVCLEQGLVKFGAINAPFIIETAHAMMQGVHLDPTKGTSYPDAFQIWLKRAKLKGVRTLDVDESLLVGGIEFGMHGDRGPNGARGSVRNLARIGVKSWTGHGHAPEIFEGHYRVGTSTFLRPTTITARARGLNMDCVTNADGKRQLVTIIGGREVPSVSLPPPPETPEELAAVLGLDRSGICPKARLFRANSY